jgi:hypothetical protein
VDYIIRPEKFNVIPRPQPEKISQKKKTKPTTQELLASKLEPTQPPSHSPKLRITRKHLKRTNKKLRESSNNHINNKNKNIKKVWTADH